MKKYTLRRRYFEIGTFGTLYRQDGTKVCEIAECAWHNNQKNKSCVPEGTYTITPHTSPKFGQCYALEASELGVGINSGLRTHILIHKANTPSELQGCLATGMAFGIVGKEWAVLESSKAFALLMGELNGQPATLTITRD